VELQEEYEHFEALGAEIVAIGVETLKVSTRLAQATGIEYPILADPEHQRRVGRGCLVRPVVGG